VARKKIGLALGGGAARGVAHVGVLKALDGFKIPIDYIAGTSAGAVAGVFYAAGMSVEVMEHHIASLKWSDFASLHFSKLGMMSSKPIETFVQRFLGKLTFSQLKIPFAAVATHVVSGELRALQDPNLEVAPAVRASSSFPGILDPTFINGECYCDGGASENVPLTVVKSMGADVVIGVDVIPDVALDRAPAHMMSIVDRSLDILLVHKTKLYAHHADIMLKPLTEYFASRHFQHAEQMMKMGFDSVVNNIDHIREVCL
jgi:NTE family protein